MQRRVYAYARHISAVVDVQNVNFQRGFFIARPMMSSAMALAEPLQVSRQCSAGRSTGSNGAAPTGLRAGAGDAHAGRTLALAALSLVCPWA